MLDMELVKEIRRKAQDYDRHSGCSQSVLLALQEGLGIGDVDSFKSATVLSGGVARRGETCGALLGGLMALGIASGRERIDDTEQYVRACKSADELCTDFQRKLGEEFSFRDPLKSTLCSEIQSKIYGRSFDLRDNAQRESFLKAGGHSDHGCYKVCGVAAEVAAKRLLRAA